MNWHAVQILFLKDLFLSRRYLFGYFAAGMACSALACVPHETTSFISFILILTVAIASGIHLIGVLLLGEASEQTRTFVMSLPISLLDYSIGKIAVVLTTYLIPWSAMFATTTLFTFVLPDAKRGMAAVLPVIFFFLLAGFALQLVTAVVTESVGWTICVLVGCNVLLNVFFMQLFAIPAVAAAKESDILTWPPVLLQILGAELLVIVTSIAAAFYFQTRKRDLI